MSTKEIGVTREKFYEWLDTCPIPEDFYFVADFEFGYCRVFFSFDETEEEDDGEDGED